VKESVEFAPFVLPRLGRRLRPRDNDSFESGLRRVVFSGKTNGVVAANVMRHCVAAVVYVSRDSDVGETKSVWHARVSQRADFRLPF